MQAFLNWNKKNVLHEFQFWKDILWIIKKSYFRWHNIANLLLLYSRFTATKYSPFFWFYDITFIFIFFSAHNCYCKIDKNMKLLLLYNTLIFFSFCCCCCCLLLLLYYYIFFFEYKDTIYTRFAIYKKWNIRHEKWTQKLLLLIRWMQILWIIRACLLCQDYYCSSVFMSGLDLVVFTSTSL